MRDLYLQFKDKDEANQQLVDFGFVISEDGGDLVHPNISLDLIGIIIRSEGEGDSMVTVAEEGYHVNLRVLNEELDLSSFDKFIISPKTPIRVWA